MNPSSHPRRSALVLAGLLAVGCAARSPSPGTTPAPSATPTPKTPARSVTLEELRIDVVTGPAGETGFTAYDAVGLLDEGNDLLARRQLEAAIAVYERLLQDFPDSQLVVAALYNAGLAHEGQADWVAAAERFRQVVGRAAPGSRDWLDAQFRLGGVLAESGRHAEVVQVFEKVLARDELSPADRVEALARLGGSLVELGDHPGAEQVLRSALRYHEGEKGKIEDAYYAAMAQYLLGTIVQRQFEAVPLRPPTEQLGRDMERKSELVLVARDRYIKTVAYQNAYWATAAVYQIGVMYRTFWDDFMAVPVPTDLTPEAVREYVKQVNEQPSLRKLLEKTILYHERNVAMAKGGRVSTPWSEASLAAADEARRILARQQRGDYLEPGSIKRASPALAPGRPEAGQARGEYVPARFDL